MGPSLPHGSPPDTLKTMPVILACRSVGKSGIAARTHSGRRTASVLMPMARGSAMPLRKHFVSGMPEPADTGSTYTHSAASATLHPPPQPGPRRAPAVARTS